MHENAWRTRPARSPTHPAPAPAMPTCPLPPPPDPSRRPDPAPVRQTRERESVSTDRELWAVMPKSSYDEMGERERDDLFHGS